MKTSLIMSLLGLSLLACVQKVAAEDTAHVSAAAADEPSLTETWLKLQREGEQASNKRQTLSGPAMENINKRYLDSFTRPIPERFDAGSFNSPGK